MPRYDYRCRSCENEFELVQTFAEAGSGVCPACFGPGQRVFHAVPVIYKGSGFYTTDYGRPKQPTENKNGTSESSSSSGSGSSSDSDSKTDSKSDTASKTTNDSAAKSSPDTSGSTASSTPASSS